jgi:hypothetical protein
MVGAARNNSALVNLFRKARARFRTRIVHGAGGVRGEFVHARSDRDDPSDTSPEYAERLDAYESRLRQLDRWIRAVGATPIFVTQPR